MRPGTAEQFGSRSGWLWDGTCNERQSCSLGIYFVGLRVLVRSIGSDSVSVPPVRFDARFGGDFSGDEKMPEMGSSPCSSRTPLSSSVMPVLLTQ